MDAPKASGVRVGVLGDSLSYGYMVRAGYVDVLRQRLEAHARPVAIVNDCVCGSTLEDGARRLSWLLESGPFDVILVQFGVNDAYIGVSPSSFAASLARVLDRLAREAPEASIVLVPPMPLADPAEERLVAPIRQILTAAADPPRVRVAPVAERWRDDEGRAPRGLYLMDGVHPSEAGYERMAAAVWEAMRSQGE
jgi:acyl-CoA thioesterase I